MDYYLITLYFDTLDIPITEKLENLEIRTPLQPIRGIGDTYLFYYMTRPRDILLNQGKYSLYQKLNFIKNPKKIEKPKIIKHSIDLLGDFLYFFQGSSFLCLGPKDFIEKQYYVQYEYIDEESGELIMSAYWRSIEPEIYLMTRMETVTTFDEFLKGATLNYERFFEQTIPIVF